MTEISEVPGITEPLLSLLREVELDTVEALTSLEVEEITQRLEDIIAQQEESMSCPSTDLVKAWQDTGRSLLRKRTGALAFEAEEVSRERMESAGVSLSALPVAKLLPDGIRERERRPEKVTPTSGENRQWIQGGISQLLILRRRAWCFGVWKTFRVPDRGERGGVEACRIRMRGRSGWPRL